MAATRLVFKGLNETISFMSKLPRELDAGLSKTNLDFMTDVKNTAKRLAPKDTKQLEQSIILEPVRRGQNVKIWKIVVEAPHGIFQEEGFTSHFAFIRNSSKMTPGIYRVSRHTPFMKPALERNINKYLNMLTVSTRRALVKAGGKNV